MNSPEKKAPPFEQESHESGIVSPVKNEILEEHSRKYPEGDPAVRRIEPEKKRPEHESEVDLPLPNKSSILEVESDHNRPIREEKKPA